MPCSRLFYNSDFRQDPFLITRRRCILKYIEFGYGNTWAIRTETELSDGTEFEQKGIVRPIKIQSVYIRIWMGKTVIILDLKEGFKKMKKKRNKVKIILGIQSL